jgi:hypothetical protein
MNAKYNTLLFSFIFILTLLKCDGAFSSSPDDFYNRHKEAVVKIIVTGRSPDGHLKTSEGSGFFVWSQNGRTFIITSTTVIGSNAKEQTSNKDWLIQEGKIERKISVSSVDTHGALIERSSDAGVLRLSNSGDIDIAILSLQQQGYPTIKIAEQVIPNSIQQDVMLLGYEKGKSSISTPLLIAKGAVADEVTTYITDKAARDGEVGGPWIEPATERVIAVSSYGGKSTPVALARPGLILLGVESILSQPNPLVSGDELQNAVARALSPLVDLKYSFEMEPVCNSFDIDSFCQRATRIFLDYRAELNKKGVKSIRDERLLVGIGDDKQFLMTPLSPLWPVLLGGRPPVYFLNILLFRKEDQASRYMSGDLVVQT